LLDKKKLLLIGEVSRISQISIKTLRHYDEIGLLKPIWVDPASNYRYYSQKQLFLLFVIQDLKSFDFSLKDIKEALKRESLEQIYKIYSKKMAETEAQMEKLKKIKERILLRFDLLSSGSHIEEDLSSLKGTYIQLKKLPARKIAYTRKVSPFTPKGVILRVSELQKLISHQTESAYIIIFHESFENPDQTDLEFGTFIGANTDLDPSIIREIPAGLYVSAVHKGTHKSSLETYKNLMLWIEANQYKAVSPPIKIYIRSLAFTQSTDKLLTEIQIQVQKK